jgi:hypothetical protein
MDKERDFIEMANTSLARSRGHPRVTVAIYNGCRALSSGIALFLTPDYVALPPRTTVARIAAGFRQDREISQMKYSRTAHLGAVVMKPKLFSNARGFLNYRRAMSRALHDGRSGL